MSRGERYLLTFDIDVEKHAAAVGLSVPFVDSQLFPEGINEVRLTVQIDSADFEISKQVQELRVPRIGRSYGEAQFDISPKRNGPSTLKATIHKQGNFIQQMEFKFDVGAASGGQIEGARIGRPLTATRVLHPRDLGLSISPASGGGNDCVVWGAVSAPARLAVERAYLASAIDAARGELMKVVMHQNAAGDYPFQTRIDIPEADREFALRTMARAGALLFHKIFYGPAAGADSKAVGDYLRKMASDPATRLRLQILGQSMPIPWGLLYIADASAGAA